MLGAHRFGRAAVDAFHAAGWHVRAFARSWAGCPLKTSIQQIEGDAFDTDSLIKAARGSDIIVHALNPAYNNWERDLPTLTASVIAAAKETGATVMIPGNIYGYGEDMPPVLTELTPRVPTCSLGHLRAEMEQSFAEAATFGVRTVILRGGDFIEGAKTGNWFDSHIAGKLDKGEVTYPGPLDRAHTWAYLPDMARAMAELAAIATGFNAFEVFGFPGYSMMGSEMVHLLSNATGTQLKIKAMPWAILKVLQLFVPVLRGVVQMRYLWNVPHTISGKKFRAALPEFQETPARQAVAASVAVLYPALHSKPAFSPARQAS
ncbi:MAG: NAD(P)H-binding protein [Kordiimonadaceae bacterium]|nr:NAD(P)H-binding protein [Kordiimonadaceae bacterium]